MAITVGGTLKGTVFLLAVVVRQIRVFMLILHRNLLSAGGTADPVQPETLRTIRGVKIALIFLLKAVTLYDRKTEAFR